MGQRYRDLFQPTSPQHPAHGTACRFRTVYLGQCRCDPWVTYQVLHVLLVVTTESLPVTKKVCCMFCRPNIQPRLTHSMVLVTMARSTVKKPPPYRWMQGCLIGRSKCTYGGTLPLSPWKVNPLCQPQPRDPARHQGLSWTCFPAPPGQPYHLSIFQFLTSCIPPRQAWSNLAYSFDLSLQVTTYSLFYCKSLNHSIKHAQTKGKHSKC